MSDPKRVLSLSAARKSRDRTERKAQADANAVRHGQTKAERLAEATREAKARAKLDGHEFDE